MTKNYLNMPNLHDTSCYKIPSRYGLLPAKNLRNNFAKDLYDDRIYVLILVHKNWSEDCPTGIPACIELLFTHQDIPNILQIHAVYVMRSTITIVSPLIDTNSSSNLDIRRVFVDEFRFLCDCYKRGILINPCRMYVRYGMDNKPHFCSLRNFKMGGDEVLYDLRSWPWCYLPPECNRNENT